VDLRGRTDVLASLVWQTGGLGLMVSQKHAVETLR